MLRNGCVFHISTWNTLTRFEQIVITEISIVKKFYKCSIAINVSFVLELGRNILPCRLVVACLKSMIYDCLYLIILLLFWCGQAVGQCRRVAAITKSIIPSIMAAPPALNSGPTIGYFLAQKSTIYCVKITKLIMLGPFGGNFQYSACTHHSSLCLEIRKLQNIFELALKYPNLG